LYPFNMLATWSLLQLGGICLCRINRSFKHISWIMHSIWKYEGWVQEEKKIQIIYKIFQLFTQIPFFAACLISRLMFILSLLLNLTLQDHHLLSILLHSFGHSSMWPIPLLSWYEIIRSFLMILLTFNKHKAWTHDVGCIQISVKH